MNHPSDAALPSHLPAGGEPGPVITRRSWLRLLVWSAAGIVLALFVVCAYALVYPERMPPAVGAIVEEITGANPNPVQLMRPQDAPLSAVALLGKQIFSTRRYRLRARNRARRATRRSIRTHRITRFRCNWAART